MPTTLSIDKLEPGMKVALPVTNKFGQVLLQTGVELSARHISALGTWGIAAVAIQAEDDTPNLSPELIAKARAELRERMDWEPVLPVELSLFSVAAKKRAMKLLRGES